MVFYARLGFGFDPRFTDEITTCMIVADGTIVMLLTEATRRRARRCCFACLSKTDGVDELVCNELSPAKALTANRKTTVS